MKVRLFSAKVILSVFFLFNIFGCDERCEEMVSPTFMLTMVNDSKEDVHLYTNGETIGPNNKLAPGEKRSKEIQRTKLQTGGTIKNSYESLDVIVVAGRNGVTITATNFTIVDQNTRKVYWDGSGISYDK